MSTLPLWGILGDVIRTRFRAPRGSSIEFDRLGFSRVSQSSQLIRPSSIGVLPRRRVRPCRFSLQAALCSSKEIDLMAAGKKRWWWSVEYGGGGIGAIWI